MMFLSARARKVSPFSTPPACLAQPPTHSHLHNGHLHAGFAEGQEGGGDHQFKIRGLETDLGLGLEGLTEKAVQSAPPDGLTIHPDALRHIGQVGRGGPPHDETCGLENVREEGAGAALAVGPCDEHHGEAPIRTAQSTEQRLDVLQSALDAEMTPFLKTSDEAGLRFAGH